MKWFDELVEANMMLGMNMMHGGTPTRAEFNNMMQVRRAKR